jgi:hypothetical protein
MKTKAATGARWLLFGPREDAPTLHAEILFDAYCVGYVNAHGLVASGLVQ